MRIRLHPLEMLVAEARSHGFLIQIALNPKTMIRCLVEKLPNQPLHGPELSRFHVAVKDRMLYIFEAEILQAVEQLLANFIIGYIVLTFH